MKIKKPFVVLLLALVIQIPVAYPECVSSSVLLKNLQQKYHSTNSDSLKIVYLLDMAKLFFDRIFDLKAADSVAEMAIIVADKSGDPKLEMLALCGYIETNDLDTYHDKAIIFANRSIQIAEKEKNATFLWLSLKCLSDTYLNLRRANYPEALKTSYRAMSVAYLNNSNAWLIQSFINLGQSYEGLNLKMDALKYYLKATDLAENLDDDNLLIKCYSKLSSFYLKNTLYSKSLDYKKLQLSVLKRQTPIDSVAFMWIAYDTMYIYSKANNGVVCDINKIKRTLDYCYHTENEKLKKYIYALARTQLIESEQIGLLRKLYMELYPAEFRLMGEEDPDIYLRLKAFFCEQRGLTDSALYYFKAAEYWVNKSHNKFNKSNFYFRLGQFYKRHNNAKAAIDNFSKAYKFASSAGKNASLPFMLAAIKPLEKLYLETGDFENAYTCSVVYNELVENRRAIEKKEQVLMMDLTNAQQKRDIENLKEKQRNTETIRKRQHERNLMAGGIGVFVIISFFLFRNYRNQKRYNVSLNTEKRKSDELLLNILPSETADELKLTGSAKAKRFEEVTVMFTDFKNFTIASELMGPEELVKIIDYYFSAFDRIISKYAIEKIKIIGDSYMCAGGIPVPNSNHAAEVVKAALDMQAFISTEKELSVIGNKPYFELRIGIHTGPVVAGIVGIKKFAYDIWGDTVNTASRMESSGEVNRVNISGSTYEKVKDHFICTYRGKVMAKNKGEVDMYFVEGVKGEKSPF